MPQNEFAKQVTVAFDEVIMPKFEDALVLSKKVRVKPTDSTTMERSGDVLWRPMHYIAKSNDGMDATNNFKQITQQSVPATLGFQKHVAWSLDAKELRDQLQRGRFGEAAAQKLASDVNIAVMDTVCNQATVIVRKTSAAADFDDVAQVEGIFNRNGVDQMGRQIAYSTKDYNKLARDLANRGTLTGKAVTAYEKALIGDNVASFTAHKLDYANICVAAAGSGLTVSTQTAAANYHVPKATTIGTNGEQANFDNRYDQITISATTGVVAGDMFTIAGVNEVHHITKRSTGELKTFRVIRVDSATVLTISPPMISAQGGSLAEQMYQNCDVTVSSTAAIVFLNTVAQPMNPFWVEDSVELLPAHYEVPQGAGVKVSRATTEQGIEVVMTEGVDIDTLKYKVRWDIFFGVVVLQPEMVGVQIFSQT